MNTRRKINSGGFTLLELIIVMFLISIVLAISTVFFANTLPSSKFSATTRDITAALRQARSLAQTKGERQTMTLDMDARTYGIEGLGTKTLPSGVNMKVEDPVNGELTTGKYSLVFYEIGGADGGTIVLWDNKRTVRISIDPVLGAAVAK